MSYTGNRFGSKIMGDRTNILYNNQMDDFSCPSGEFNSFSLPNYSINYVQPGKRPVSSMTPLIALDENKNTRLVCGSSGGTRIITSTALVSYSLNTLTTKSSHLILIHIIFIQLRSLLETCYMVRIYSRLSTIRAFIISSRLTRFSTRKTLIR